jgi:hypothetical protein
MATFPAAPPVPAEQPVCGRVERTGAAGGIYLHSTAKVLMISKNSLKIFLKERFSLRASRRSRRWAKKQGGR